MPRAVAEVTYTLEQLGVKGTSCLPERLTDPGFKASLVASGNPHFDEETLAILRRLVLGGDEAMSWAPRATIADLMSYSQFHSIVCLYLHMHGLIF